MMDRDASVELLVESKKIRSAIGEYILRVHQSLFKDGMIQKISLELQSRNNCIPLGVISIPFGHSSIVYSATVEDPVLSAETYDKDSFRHLSVSLRGENIDTLTKFCKHAEEMMFELKDDCINAYVWKANNSYWDRRGIVFQRDMGSVVVDPKEKQRLLADITSFEAHETREWYKKHGIPYKRGYLFHGPPGTGKTSMIRALATLLKRSIHTMTLVQQGLTDMSLSQALQDVEGPAIVVFEDVDALFNTQRDKLDHFALTFAGLLNAIDGVTTSLGLILIFTTNFPEKLDKALVRKGRIDHKMHFTRFGIELCRQMFSEFYPSAPPTIVAQFATAARGANPSSLQHHFILCRNKTQEEAAHFKGDEYDNEYECSTSMHT